MFYEINYTFTIFFSEVNLLSLPSGLLTSIKLSLSWTLNRILSIPLLFSQHFPDKNFFSFYSPYLLIPLFIFILETFASLMKSTFYNVVSIFHAITMSSLFVGFDLCVPCKQQFHRVWLPFSLQCCERCHHLGIAFHVGDHQPFPLSGSTGIRTTWYWRVWFQRIG